MVRYFYTAYTYFKQVNNDYNDNNDDDFNDACHFKELNLCKCQSNLCNLPSL